MFEIEEVGIKNLVYPVKIDQFQTAGTFSFSTSLNKDEKGINMSRILESVEKHYNNGLELISIHYIKYYVHYKTI